MNAKKENGAKLVSEAIVGLDGQTVVVAGKLYLIQPPTIKKLAGAGAYLYQYGDEKNMGDFITKMKNMTDACKALSWFISGDESLAEDLGEGTLQEITQALEVGVSLVGVENFLKLSLLGRSVQTLIAKQK